MKQKEERKNKKHNGRINKGRIIRDFLKLKKKKKKERKRKNIMKDWLRMEWTGIEDWNGIKDGLFEQQKEDYYEPKRVNNFWNNN